MIGQFSTPPSGTRNQQQQAQQQSLQQRSSQQQLSVQPPIPQSFSQSNGYTLGWTECSEHPGERVTNFCSCSECLCPLCPECVPYHNTWHKQQQNYAEIETIKGVKQRCEAKILDSTHLLEQSIRQGETSLLIPEDNLDEALQMLQLQRTRIQELIDAHFKTLEDKLVQNQKDILAQVSNFQPIFTKMRATIEELNELHVLLDSYENSMEAIQRICQMDVAQIVGRFKNELNRAASASKIERIYPRLDESRLFFLTEEISRSIQLQVQNQPVIISRNQLFPQKSTQSFKQPQQSSISDSIEITTKDTFDSRAPRKYLHFFQNDYNKLHYIDLSTLERYLKILQSSPSSKQNQPNLQFLTVDLQISFRIPSFHKSIALPSGELYLTGGTIPDGSMQKSGQIYQYNWSARSLQPLGNMISGRSSHGIAYLNNKIYVVGGYGDKHIMTNKCERFNLSTFKWERVGSMNHPAASLALCSCNDRYLYKFGGIGEGLEADGGVLNSYIEKYDLQEDVWEIIDPKIKNTNGFNNEITNDFCLLSTSAAIQVAGDRIFVFGGYHEDNSGSDQTFILQINEEEKSDDDYDNNRHTVSQGEGEKQDRANQRIPAGKDAKSNTNPIIGNINNNLTADYALTNINSKRLPFSEAFWNNLPVISNNKIFALQNIAGENTDNCLENERRVLVFDQLKWISLS